MGGAGLGEEVETREEEKEENNNNNKTRQNSDVDYVVGIMY